MKRLWQKVRLSWRCPGWGKAQRRLREWYASPLGQAWLEAERLRLEPVLGRLFGYHLLQVGRPNHGDLLTASRIPHRIILDAGEGAIDRESVVGNSEMLPFSCDSLDLVLLPHTLEFAEEPHQVLREAERVLIPEGHLVILGFNPWGSWGLARLLYGWRHRYPWCGRFLMPWQLRDWLSLLGFDTVSQQGYFYRPPLPRTLLHRLGFIETLGKGGCWLSGGYLLVAKKRVSTLTPIRPRWRPRRSLLAGGLTEPSARREKHDRTV